MNDDNDDMADEFADERDDDSPVDEYRPVSGLAVAALVVGCLSIVATYSPLLWAVPVVGAILAASALRELSSPGVVKVGRLAALAGLALSIGIGCQAVTRHVLGRSFLERRAVEVADRWIADIREDRLLLARSALALELRPPVAMVGSEDNPKPVHDPVAEEESFRRAAIVVAIRGCGGKEVAHSEFVGFDEESQESHRAWHVRVRLAPCDDGREVVVRLKLDMEYEQKAGSWRQFWTITGVSLGDAG